MNLAHLHLLLNHVPLLGSLFGVVLLVYALATKNTPFQKLSLTIFMLSALCALPVYFTGEPAEEVVENLPGVAESYIEQHEDAAKAAIVSMALLGITSLAALVAQSRQKLFSNLTTAALLVSLATAGFMVRTASLGGAIRHTEIRSGTTTSTNEAGERDGREAREHDD